MPITPPSDVVTGTERPTRAPMAASDLIALLDRLQDAAIAVWLDGGWGVDALLGEQTREHDDLDLVSTVDDARGLIETLNAAGYRLAAGDPSTNFVLLDS
ncbi:MAG: nucleotidyltransferase domain-containing protein, partial [Chloroflexota bacterium]